MYLRRRACFVHVGWRLLAKPTYKHFSEWPTQDARPPEDFALNALKKRPAKKTHTQRRYAVQICGVLRINRANWGASEFYYFRGHRSALIGKRLWELGVPSSSGNQAERARLPAHYMRHAPAVRTAVTSCSPRRACHSDGAMAPPLSPPCMATYFVQVAA